MKNVNKSGYCLGMVSGKIIGKIKSTWSVGSFPYILIKTAAEPLLAMPTLATLCFKDVYYIS
jgi:hypothetical protein